MPDRSDSIRSASTSVAVASAGLCALAVAMGIGRFAFTPILPMMLHDAGLTLTGGSLLASANYIGYLIGALMATLVRVTPSTAIRGGLLAIALTTLAMASSLPLPLWMALRLLAGVASAWVLISVSSWSLGALARFQMPWLGNLVFAGVGLGIASAGVLCLLLTAWGGSAAEAWLALGGLSLLAGLLTWNRFALPTVAANDSMQAPPPGLDAAAWRMILCYGVYGFGYIIPATYLPLMAKQALPNPALFGWSWPLFGLAAAFSTVGAAPLLRRFGARAVWMGCHFLMALGVALPVFAPGLAGIFLAAVLVGGTFIVVTVCAVQDARRVAGPAATRLIAAMTAAFAVGQIAGPLCAAYVLDTDGGFSHSLLAAGALLLASGVALRRT
ncbi:Predicted arabinose efflux permease, MFS family [Noviherbaspirillum humi]|uniref:Predicted arabinose efflux permease, MFS family n=1 Tax=Noviherbaspirillum humi TaxID=1688639 RepID=A0A239DS63_9BURK|nr:YbfB/YjiJ family MFS transporter [Noviherbaspirillum humi]SNS35039.1 Predicted arabinose efflux permease, MFS family [Noviherbaspirillum humi]